MGGSIQTSPQGIAAASAQAVWNYNGWRRLNNFMDKTYPVNSSVSPVSSTTAWANGSWVYVFTAQNTGRLAGVVMYNNSGTVGPIVGELDVGAGPSGSQGVIATFPFIAYGSRVLFIPCTAEAQMYSQTQEVWVRVRDSLGGQTYVVKLAALE